jgi:hypothetical protein
MDDWNVKGIHDLMQDVETTEGATMERNALLNLFDYIRQLEESYDLSYQRNRESNVRIGELLAECNQLQKRGDEAIREAGQLWTKIHHAKEALK